MFEKVREMISECFEIDEDEITLSANFSLDLGFDEIDMADLIMDIKTVGDLIKFIEENN